MPNKKIVFDSDEDASEDELGETTLASVEAGEENKTDEVKNAVIKGRFEQSKWFGKQMNIVI